MHFCFVSVILEYLKFVLLSVDILPTVTCVKLRKLLISYHRAVLDSQTSQILKTTFCQMSTSAYEIFLQVPSTTGCLRFVYYLQEQKRPFKFRRKLFTNYIDCYGVHGQPFHLSTVKPKTVFGHENALLLSIYNVLVFQAKDENLMTIYKQITLLLTAANFWP